MLTINPNYPSSFFCSFLIYRLEKYLVKRGFQVKYKLPVIFFKTHILSFDLLQITFFFFFSSLTISDPSLESESVNKHNNPFRK